MGHHVVGSDKSLLSEKDDSQVESGAAFEQVFPQASDAQSRVQMRRPKALSKRHEGVRHRISLGDPQFPGALLKSRMKVNSHNLPENGLVWPDTLADLTSALTALKARSACFSLTPYS
jgi:hypothetical protein